MHSEVIRKAIEVEARKRLARRASRLNSQRRAQRIFTKRTGVQGGAPPIPALSKFGLKHFDPAYCLKHSKFLARGIAKSIDEKNYSPSPCIRFSIPKGNGKHRNIHVFSIPDTAVSNLLARRLIKRNQRRYSANSYSYRYDKSALDAIDDLKSILSTSRIFFAKVDLENYFDSINHSWIRQISTSSDFQITESEKQVLYSFLQYRFHEVRNGRLQKYKLNRRSGIPQGASVSLFLSNIAAHSLDMEFERQNGSLFRYADDSLFICFEYSDASRFLTTFEKFAATSGVRINYGKSTLISLLDGSGGEIRSSPDVSFLGYKFTRPSSSANLEVAMADGAVLRLKRRVATIIYRHLLLYPRRGYFSPRRLNPEARDWDLVTAINDLRRYVYGGLSHNDILGFVKGHITNLKFQGIMAYYCLATAEGQFKALDGWLVDALSRAYRARTRLLASKGFSAPSIGTADLIQADWYRHSEIGFDPRLPSFFLGWRAASIAWTRVGPRSIVLPRNTYLYGLEEGNNEPREEL